MSLKTRFGAIAVTFGLVLGGSAATAVAASAAPAASAAHVAPADTWTK
jgi:hypothetical protein